MFTTWSKNMSREKPSKQIRSCALFYIWRICFCYLDHGLLQLDLLWGKFRHIRLYLQCSLLILYYWGENSLKLQKVFDVSFICLQMHCSRIVQNLLLMQQFFWWQGGLTYRSWKTNLVLDIRTADPTVWGGEGAHRLAIQISITWCGKKSSTLVNPTFRTVAPISMAVPTAPSKSSFLRKTIVNSRSTSLRYFPLLSSSIKPAVLLYALCLVGTFYAATWSWGWTPMSMCPCVCVRQAGPCGSTVDLPCASLNST